jgi:hypothetical protein
VSASLQMPMPAQDGSTPVGLLRPSPPRPPPSSPYMMPSPGPTGDLYMRLQEAGYDPQTLLMLRSRLQAIPPERQEMAMAQVYQQMMAKTSGATQ